MSIMDVYSLARQRPAFLPGSSILTIGVYDGVHLGHQATIQRVVNEARTRGLRSVVATFDPHPMTVVRPEAAPELIGTLEQRLSWLEATGVDATVIIDFDHDRSQESAIDFIDEVVVGEIGAAHVIVGEGFHFGHDRVGDLGLLQSAGAERGFTAESAPLIALEGKTISSTRIRAAIAAGDVVSANAMLCRSHETIGVVDHGDGRGGKELGFPTANLATDRTVVYPADGVYAGWYRDDDLGLRNAAISVGRRPTFLDGAEPLIEVFVLDYDGDLYGHQATVYFLERLRSQERYQTISELVAQMRADVLLTRSKLAEAHEFAPSAQHKS